MTDLHGKLEEVDFTNSNKGADVAFAALRLMQAAQCALEAHNAGMLLGRDEALNLAVRVRECGEHMGLLPRYATGAESDQFHKDLL